MNNLLPRSPGRNRGRTTFELLERRTLMSAWTTVDTYQQTPGGISYVSAMASDAAGNVYAAGRSDNSSGSTSIANAVIREKISGSANWTTIEVDTSAPNFGSIATDARGNLFVAVHTPAADTGPQWQILERPAGQTAFAVVDQLSALGQCNGLATDAAGDVFACGEVAEPYTVRGQTGLQDHWIVRKWTAGSSGFVTVDDHVDYSTWNSMAHAITVIAGGSAAGIYVVGRTPINATYEWLVRKSADGGASWSTVDTFTDTPSSSAPAVVDAAWAVASDAFGNAVYVVGGGTKETISGLGKKGAPVYTTSDGHWLVRRSSTGGANSWSISDDFQIGSAPATARAVGTDLAGNVYVAGSADDSTPAWHSIVRSNIGGTWSTVNDYQPSGGVVDFDAFTVDASGNSYVGGDTLTIPGDSNSDTWIVQSAPGPAPAASGSPLSAASTTFSTTLITSADAADNGTSWLETPDDLRLP